MLMVSSAYYHPMWLFLKLSGAGGIRTPYLLRAKQMFSQLNYGPKLQVNYSILFTLTIFLATHACCCYT